MDYQQVRALAQQFVDALHALEQGDEGDVESLVELFSEDAHLQNPILKLDRREYAGRDGARRFWTEYRRTVGQAYSEFHEVVVNESAAGLFWTTRGTAAGGQALEYEGATLLVFDDSGKIQGFRGYYDTRELGREVGAS